MVIAGRYPCQSPQSEPCPGLPRHLGGNVFPVTPNALRGVWRRAAQKVGIDNLRFHDLRHEATSRFFEKGLNVMEVAVITGHKT